MINLLSEQIKDSKEPLEIVGRESKLTNTNKKLSIADYQGIVSYQASELVITVKAGTSLQELQQVLASKNQMLSFEPPDYGNSSIGGTYACALSGSAQAFRGSLRDFVLGIKIINGEGKILSFGGQMMKNVAGYDVARLLVGSKGSLAVIAEISFKVLPQVTEATYSIEMLEDDAIILMNKWAATALPLSACAYYQGRFYYRLFGKHDKQQAEEMDNKIWQTLNPFQTTEKEFLWRASVPSTTSKIANTVAIDCCGNRRWIVSEHKPDLSYVDKWQKGLAISKSVKHPAQMKIEQGLKKVFDPHGVYHHKL
jgi:glycolate oxidase FAD binding subunit